MTDIAHHEACHAVMGVLLGMRLEKVWIDGSSNGETEFAGPDILLRAGECYRTVSLKEALVDVAPAVYGHKLSDGDMKLFYRALWLGGWPQPPGFIRRQLIEFAKEILCTPQNTAACGLLADELTRRGFLCGHEAEQIIKDARDANS